jgi:hypothetical protein
MKTREKLTFIAGACFLLSFFFLWSTVGVEAAIYKYTDKNGGVHFTDRFESIPKEYRDQIKTIPVETPSPPAAPSTQKETGMEKALEEEKKKEAGVEKALDEEKKKEAALKAALEKAACEEKKLKSRGEKVDRISELQKEIENRRQEMQSLRTTWMVYDRNTIYRLNNEIAEIQQQIGAIQQEMAGENQPCP